MDGATEKRLAWLLALGLGLVIAWLIATDSNTLDPESTPLATPHWPNQASTP